MKRYEHLAIEDLLPQFQQWVGVFQRREIGNVFFLPNTGILYRSNQLADWYKEAEIVDVESAMLTEVKNLREFLEEKKSKKLILVMRRMLSGIGGRRVAEIVAEQSMRRSEGLLLMHDMPYSELSGEVKWPMVIYQNKWHYLLPRTKVVRRYLDNLLSDWQVKMDEEVQGEVVRHCGGYLWIVNEMVRSYQGGMGIVELGELGTVVEKKDLIWESLSDSYREVLINGDGEKRVKEEMMEVGVLDTSNQIAIEWLREWVNIKKGEQFVIEVGRIVYLDRNVTSDFSEREQRALAMLWEGKGVVGRDALGELWGEEGYSDWALDQMIRRLREKIARLALPVKISTRKGKGYELARK